MGNADRRDKVALDEAYSFYRDNNSAENLSLHGLVNSLKTVTNALAASEQGHLKLTTRLWLRIKQALFDRLITTFPAYMIIYDANQAIVEPKQRIPDDGAIEIHPQGLRRNDDKFTMEVKHLHPLTKKHIEKVWLERGAMTRQDDFSNMECTDSVCVPKLFAIGDEVLLSEANNGKKQAYGQWWGLYWQVYCTPDRSIKVALQKQMTALELVWGNLYY